MNTIPKTNRRAFLKRVALASTSSLAAGAFSRMQLMQSALAADNYSGLDDHKTLVCVFLFGGNDGFNMVVPNQSTAYNQYASIRQSMAVPKAGLHALGNIDYGFHPSCAELADLYQQGNLALIANAGNLIEPVTRTTINNQTAVLPPELFSHNDQQEFSSTLLAPAIGTTNKGWGGRMADLLQEANPQALLSASYTLDGSNIWQAGHRSRPMAVDASGVVPNFKYFENDSWPLWERSRTQAWESILNQSSSNLLMQQIAGDMLKTKGDLTELSSVLGSLAPINTEFNQQNNVARQLETAAKLIAARQTLGLKRQIIFVAASGYDTHSDQNGVQPVLLGGLSNALGSFNTAMDELGVSDSVTTFTLSEFGRSLTSNGDGTDHAWGSHHLVMGGAVSGGKAYGKFPNLRLDGPDDMFDDGRIIPTTSTDQYAATLGKWMDLSDSDLLDIMPNLHRFSKRDLGFMAKGTAPDSDGDGVPDSQDNCNNTANSNQLNSDNDPLGDACDADDDNDGMSDVWEKDNGLNPKSAHDKNLDADGDGFSNLQEFNFGTDPNIADTDKNNNDIPDVIDRRRGVLPAIFSLLFGD